MSYSTVGHEFSVSESSIYILNKLALNRSTHKIGWCIDWLMKILWSETRRNLALYFPKEQWFSIYWFSVLSDFIDYNYSLMNNENQLYLYRLSIYLSNQLNFNNIKMFHYSEDSPGGWENTSLQLELSPFQSWVLCEAIISPWDTVTSEGHLLWRWQHSESFQVGWDRSVKRFLV